VRRTAWACCTAALLGFTFTTARLNFSPDDVNVRLPENQRLAGLIRLEQERSERLRSSADGLRRRIRELQASQGRADAEAVPELDRARRTMGLLAVAGPGLVVELNDSAEEQSPSGNLNDLVIHSTDVQAVANGLWTAGAEALSVNGERVVATSALLCVGNTLLINGTVHSPPYRFVAIGRDLRDRFLAHPLVKRFGDDAERFRLGFSVEERDRVEVPAYQGTTAVKYAKRT
jgi:uncharacterized protein YlxW (UPF0749 family)